PPPPADGGVAGGCPGAGDCCVANGSPGCDDAKCCNAVCAILPGCCFFNWDNFCALVAAGDPVNCPQCIPTTGACCIGNGTCVDGVTQAECDALFGAFQGLGTDCLTTICPPANNDCASRVPIFNGATPFSNIGDTTDGPNPCGAIGSDIWYNYNAAFTGDLTVSLCGSTFDTVVAVYDGCACPANLVNLLACNDQSTACPNLSQSQVTVPVVNGQCYKIQVGGFTGLQGNGTITITKAPAPPPNDDCASRVPIFNGKTPFDNTGASFDGPIFPAGGAHCLNNMTSDVWWNYTADFTGTVNIDTCQSTGMPTDDTTLVVYDGCDCATIHCGIDGLPGGVLAQDDDTCAAPPGGGKPFLSSVKIPVVAGNCYKIQLGGWDGGGMDPGTQGSGIITISKQPGACCVWDGTCVDGVFQAGCDALGGVYQGDGTTCAPGLCPPPPTGANFFTDPNAFQQALLNTDKRAKASWDFKPNKQAPGTFVALDDPLNINTHGLNPDDPWTDTAGDDLWPPSLDNVTFQSNLGPNPQAPLPNPGGIDGLVFGTPGFADNDNNVLLANSFPDSFDIISGPPAGDNHTAMSIEIVTFESGPPPGPVFVTVFDKFETPVGKIKVDIVVNPPPGGPKKAFLGIIMKGNLTIGRVNLFDLGGGFEGISKITVYSDSPGILNTDISGPLGAGFPDGCVDAFDLGTLLGAWCSAAGDPDPPGDVDPPCEDCTSPNAVLADLSGPDGAPDGCVDAFDLAKLLAEWCSVAGGNPCGTCGP
ncbi:MAG: hypothetical protein O6758_06605, partial [Planctomycetota bacterium]|nr:hypothetical protein [Planctomycetota bacterium]